MGDVVLGVEITTGGGGFDTVNALMVVVDVDGGVLTGAIKGVVANELNLGAVGGSIVKEYFEGAVEMTGAAGGLVMVRAESEVVGNGLVLVTVDLDPRGDLDAADNEVVAFGDLTGDGLSL